MKDFETRFATPLLCLETTLAQLAPTADVVADLAARLSVIEEQSGLQQRVSTVLLRQGHCDLQELAAHVNRLSRKALSGRPTTTKDLIAANAFVDAINNRSIQHFMRLARPIDVQSASAVAPEEEIHERSQAAEDPYRRQPYTDAPSRTRLLALTQLHDPTAVLRCYHCHDVGHFARNCPWVTKSLTNSAPPMQSFSGNYNAGHREQDLA
ncbi:hypothetical protein HPB51_001961 [Rhipicephalus microplus]|uniref:CCHC-type domain-containing protein n=1 Tax=Rhipicephalus microplus TaxID=6941 RepID=A0A9J6DYX9_RHIMP|nr:hypothetical protein HPB51_001961 [Rhipicephalus microplus]